MEELSYNFVQIPSKQILTPTNNILYSVYTYSSRYIPMPQKTLDSSQSQICTHNQSFYQQTKQKIQDQYEQLSNYINQIQLKLQNVKQDQYSWLGDKYRYYIRKFKKYLTQQQKLLEAYNNLQKTIIQSPPVQEQLKSINFIRMISTQTQQKLEKLRYAVKKAEEQKDQKQKYLQSLRKQLKQLKTEYFSKKREQQNIRTEIIQRQKEKKLAQVDFTMTKIRFYKRKKLQEIKNLSVNTNSSFSVQRRKLNYFNSSDFIANKSALITNQNMSIKQNTLPNNLNKNLFEHDDKGNQKYIKLLSQTCDDFKSRQLETKKQINNNLVTPINLENARQKSRQKQREYRKSQEQQLLTNQQIIKQLSLTNRMREQFTQKRNEQILNILIRTKKVKQLFKIIEEVKRQEKNKNLIEKRKLNLMRSETYKSNSNLVFSNT